MPSAKPSLVSRTLSTGTSVVLLGSAGGAAPSWGRHGIASAVSVNGAVYLIDCGLGTSQRMVQAGFMMSQLRALFVSHLHSDHFDDYFNLIQMTQAAIPTALNGIGHAIDVYGPDRPGPTPGNQVPTRSIGDVTTDFLDANAYELATRPGNAQVNVHLLDPGVVSTALNVAPPMSPFKVMEDENVRVTATLVDHPPMAPSYAFRFDTADGSVVFSGDTGPSQNLITLAKGADVLVHEAFDLAWLSANAPALVTPFEAAHTPSTSVGLVAAAAGVRTLVLSHLVPGDPRAVPDSRWLAAARSNYGGRVVVGHDLAEVRLPAAAARPSA
jgi:ribonuclease BN (tRNA processing enzyme)